MIAILRLLLLVAYVPLAHFAGVRHSPTLAALALADLLLLFLIEGVLRGRPRAWLLLLAGGAGLVALARTPHALLPLLLVPPLFTALIGACFLRSLRPGRTPLIAKPIAAIYGLTPETLPPAHARYARGLTLAWALLLAVLTALNLTLALIAVPDGVLARLGVAAPLTVTHGEWSLIANIGNYGLLLGFAAVEFQLRKRVFPVRPYRNAFDFARRMAALGPGFWRDFFR